MTSVVMFIKLGQHARHFSAASILLLDRDQVPVPKIAQCHPLRSLVFGPDWAGDLTRDESTFAPLTRVRDRSRVHEALCVGMLRVLEHLTARSHLHDLPQIHDCDPMGDALDDSQVMADEEIGQVGFLLQFDHQGEHRCPDGDVQGRYRFIGDDEAGVEGKRSRTAGLSTRGMAPVPEMSVSSLLPTSADGTHIRRTAVTAPRESRP